MRIAFIVPYLYRFQRGIESSACRLASALADLGHEVTVIAWTQWPQTSHPVLSPKVRVRSVPYFRYFRGVVAGPFYRHFFRNGRFDLINVYFADCGEAGPIRATKSALGFRLQFIAGYPPDLVPHRYDAFDRLRLTPLLDRVVAKSFSLAEGIERRLSRPTVMIPNGVDPGHFSPEAFPREECRKNLGIDPRDRVVVTVAALEERKGIQYVLRALPSLLNKGHAVRYLIAGEGSYRGHLEKEASRFGLQKVVRFLGNLDDVRPILGAADAFALLSHGEGFPNALLEAWAMDLPVLVSQHPPYPDIVLEHLGRLVNEADEESVATTLEQMLFTVAGNRGIQRRHVTEKYSWKKIAAEVIA